MNINRNKTFNFVPVNKENNYYDLSYEIKDIEIKNINQKDLDNFINRYLFSIDKLYLDVYV